MTVNQGKLFEEQFKKSIPHYALLYRLPDSAQSFGSRNNKLRFSSKSPFDYLMWDSKKHILYAFELKTVKGKSISFERHKEQRGIIHYHQIQALSRWNKYDGIICGFIIEFRKVEKTIFIDIDEFNKLINFTNKKSFNLDDLIKYDINYKTIGQVKARTRYTYQINSFLENM